MKTLKDFWNEASGIYNFVDKNGASIDDMDYPLETEVLRMRWIDGEQYGAITQMNCHLQRNSKI